MSKKFYQFFIRTLCSSTEMLIKKKELKEIMECTKIMANGLEEIF